MVKLQFQQSGFGTQTHTCKALEMKIQFRNFAKVRKMKEKKFNYFNGIFFFQLLRKIDKKFLVKKSASQF